MTGKNLVLNHPGGIIRLPLHIGTAKAWHDFGLPRPDTMYGSSAGLIAESAIAGWNEEDFDEGIKIIGNLTPAQIFSFRRKLKVKLAALGITTVGLGALILFDHKLSKSMKAALGLGGLATLLGADAIVGNELIHSESHFYPGPLTNLLEKNLNFRSIFKSSILLGAIVTDVNKPGEVIFYNHDPRNSDPDNPEHRRRWINILLASARLPGKFPFVKIDDIDTMDGEVWTDFPIRQMKEYRKIIRFDYWPPLTPAPAPREWIADLDRSFQIMRDRCTHKKIENYELERQAHPTLPEVFYLRLDQELLNLMPSNVFLHNFTPDQMKLLQNIGYRLVEKEYQNIKSYLES